MIKRVDKVALAMNEGALDVSNVLRNDEGRIKHARDRGLRCRKRPEAARLFGPEVVDGPLLRFFPVDAERTLLHDLDEVGLMNRIHVAFVPEVPRMAVGNALV